MSLICNSVAQKATRLILGCACPRWGFSACCPCSLPLPRQVGFSDYLGTQSTVCWQGTRTTLGSAFSLLFLVRYLAHVLVIRLLLSDRVWLPGRAIQDSAGKRVGQEPCTSMQPVWVLHRPISLRCLCYLCHRCLRQEQLSLNSLFRLIQLSTYCMFSALELCFGFATMGLCVGEVLAGSGQKGRIRHNVALSDGTWLSGGQHACTLTEGVSVAGVSSAQGHSIVATAFTALASRASVLRFVARSLPRAKTQLTIEEVMQAPSCQKCGF